MMDLQQTIHQLEIQKQKIEFVISELEQLQNSNDSGSVVMENRRGRKSMGSEERGQVSERMRRYWANRRKQREQVKS